MPTLVEQIQDAKSSGVLLSLHMKATMMKVSDPIIFGHAIRLFFADVFEKYDSVFRKIGVNPNNGYDNILEKLNKLDDTQRLEIEWKIFKKIIKRCYCGIIISVEGSCCVVL